MALGDDDIPALRRFAALVRSHRLRKGWSQQMLADASGVSRDVVKRLEAGSGDIRGSVMLRVLHTLDCRAGDLCQIVYGVRRREGVRSAS